MKPWLTIKNQSGEGPVEFYIYEEIGENWWDGSGVAAKQFAESFNAVPAGRKISLRINSPGGSIADGLAIYNTVAKRAADVTAFVDGYALSAASFVMLAASKVVAPENAIIMIHKPQAAVMGDAEQMRQMADILDTHQDSLASIYVEATGKSKAAVNSALDAETWFTGKEAKDWGLVDETTEPANINNAFDLTQFKNLPAAIAGNTPHQSTNSAPSPDATAAVNLSGSGLVVGASGQSTNTETKDNTMPDNTAPTAPVVTTPPAAEPAAPPAAPAAAAPQIINLSPEAVQAVATALAAIQNRNQPPGVAPVAPSPSVENMGSAARNAINAKPIGRSRFEFIRDNWNDLARHNRVVPIYNANTTDAALTTDMLASALIVVLQNRLAPLAAFTRDFGTDRMKPKATVQVPIVLSGGTAQVNATSFEDTTNFVGTIDNVAITVNRITSGAHITPAELNSGFRMAQWSEIKAAELADKIQAAVNAIITTGNFDRTTELGAAALISAAASFGFDELNSLWAAISKADQKFVMLDPSYFKQFLPHTLEDFNPLSVGMPGWNGFFNNTYWAGAEANTKGFACNPQAIAVASGLPLASPNRDMSTVVQTITLPGIGLVVEQQQWYATGTKADWANWEVMFGAAKGDPAAGVLVKSS